MRYPLLVALLVTCLLSLLSLAAKLNTGKQEAELKYYCEEVEAGSWADFEGRCPRSKAREARLKKMT